MKKTVKNIKAEDIVVDHDGSIGDQLSKDIQAMSEEEQDEYFANYARFLSRFLYGD